MQLLPIVRPLMIEPHLVDVEKCLFMIRPCMVEVGTYLFMIGLAGRFTQYLKVFGLGLCMGIIVEVIGPSNCMEQILMEIGLQHLRRAQLCEDRAQQLFGDLPGLGRAQHVHGDFLKVIGLSTSMVIYLNLIGLCMVVLWRSLGFMVFNKMGVFMVERKGKELWVWLQCRHRGSRLEEEVEEKRS